MSGPLTGQKLRLPGRFSRTAPARQRPRPARSDLAPSLTWLDRLIGWFSPRRLALRVAGRMRVKALSRFYDGATSGRRGASIRYTGADSTTITWASITRLREAARDLVRNNPHARRGIDVLEWNVVGTGIATRFVRNGKRAEDVEALARAHLGTRACDADGAYSYGGLQSLAVRSMFESGEVLIRRRRRRLNDGLPVPVQFQVLEPDYIDTLRDGPLPNGAGQIVQGVQFNPIGMRTGYWLFSQHPGSRYGHGSSHFVPASDIIHLYVPERPGQVRGVTRLAPVILRLADFADYEDAQLVRQKIAACFTAFIQEAFEGSSLPAGVTQDSEGNYVDTLEPGAVERLPPGTEIQFANPPELQNYDQYTRTSLRAIAAGMGISYEAMTGDYSNTNFSSGRMGHLEFQRNIARIQQLVVIPTLCAQLEEWFLEAAMLMGANIEGVEAHHVPPRREMIDPTKEVPAYTKAVRSGQMTLSQVIMSSGRDPRQHLEEYKADIDLLDELGLTVTSDVRKVQNLSSANSGAAAGQ